jgi:hypothetical protein
MSEATDGSAEAPDATLFDVPEGATYGPHPVTEIGYAPGFEHVYVVYEDDDLPDGWDQLMFDAEGSDAAGEVRVVGAAVGVMPPERARGGDSPGAQTARDLYRILTEAGIDVSGWDADE